MNRTATSAWLTHLPENVGAAELAAAMILDEIRVEAVHVRKHPSARQRLRVAARELEQVGIPTACDTEPWMLAREAALVLGRVDAGILAEHEAAQTRAAVVWVLGSTLLSHLRVVWRFAIGRADDDTAGMLRAGRRWCLVLGVDPNQEPSSSLTCS